MRPLRNGAGQTEDDRGDQRVQKGGSLDGISAATGANAAGQVMAALQIFAVKQATQTEAAAAAALIETIGPSSPIPGPANLGRNVDATA